MAIQIQLRHDTTANWNSENPVLAVGELGYNTTTNEFKIGDGESTWSELQYYASATSGDIKTRVWGYPSNNAVAVMPATDNESIALKSSYASSIRWHPRNNGFSYGSDGNPDLIPLTATLTATEGGWFADFTFAEQDSVPYFGEDFHYNINVPGSAGWDGLYYAISATTTTMRVFYSVEPDTFVAQGAYISQPSVYAQFEVNSAGAFVKIADWSDGMGGSYSQLWQFTKDGAIAFPYQSSNSRTGSGEVLKFGNSSSQSIITGPPTTEGNPTAQRLVIAGQDGFTGTTGEGGDLYLWAGRGGSSGGTGGDIKVDAGNGQATGQGGTVKVRGGYAVDAVGGFIEITAGSSANSNGGNVDINAGDNYNDTESIGGNVNITAGSSGTFDGGGDVNITAVQSGTITLNGDGGEFLNDSSNFYNQIVTIATKSVYPMVLATDGSPVTGTISHVGNLFYANLVQDTAQFVIPTNATVAFPVGCEIKFATSGESAWSISVADGMTTTLIGEWTLGAPGVGGPFIVPSNSTATLVKVETERWIISGIRLTD